MAELQLKQFKVEYTTFSKQGQRPDNQDRVFADQIGEDTALFMVADGMGGYASGGKAAELAIHTIKCNLENYKTTDQETIQHSVSKANFAINKSLPHSGTTIGGVILNAQQLHLFWVGDVQICILKSTGEMISSNSHNLLQQAKKAGNAVTSSEIERYSTIVTRSLGLKNETVTADQHLSVIEDGMKVLICSDGVANYLVGRILEEGCLNFPLCKTQDRFLAHGNEDNFSGVILSSKR